MDYVQPPLISYCSSMRTYILLLAIFITHSYNKSFVKSFAQRDASYKDIREKLCIVCL